MRRWFWQSGFAVLLATFGWTPMVRANGLSEAPAETGLSVTWLLIVSAFVVAVVAVMLVLRRELQRSMSDGDAAETSDETVGDHLRS